MNKVFDIILKQRIGLIKLINSLSIEQLNKIPTGFNNNIIWNAGHLVASVPSICYRRAGLDIKVDPAFSLAYNARSKPERFISKDEVENICRLLISTLEQLESDYDNGVFANYTPWTTYYGIEIRNINDAISFVPFHEGLHFGIIEAMKKLVVG
jgi:hypothetical protein